MGGWAGGESDGGLRVLVLCWSFPAWGLRVWQTVGLGVRSLLRPFDSALNVWASFGWVEAL